MSVLLFLAVTLCLAVFTLFLCFVVYLHHSHKVYGHIPGPKREHFFWGNLRELRRKERSGTVGIAAMLEYCLEYGPVTLLWFFHKPVVIVSDPELVKKVLITCNLPKDPWLRRLFSAPFGERLLGGGLVTEVNHDVWQRKRTAMNPAFHRKYLKELITQFNSCCDAFLDRLSSLADGETEIKMADEFNRVTLDVIGKVIIILRIFLVIYLVLGGPEVSKHFHQVGRGNGGYERGGQGLRVHRYSWILA